MDIKQRITNTSPILHQMIHLLHDGCILSASKVLKKSDILTLLTVYHNPNRSMQFYARAIKLKCGSFTYLATKLENKGYLSRVLDKSDRRKTSLKLKEKGEEIVKQTNAEFDSYMLKNIACLDEEELNMLLQSLENLETLLEIMERKNGQK